MIDKTIVLKCSGSTANFIYHKCKVGCYRLVSNIVTGNVGIMVSTNQIEGVRETPRRIRSRCNINFGQRLYKPFDAAALRLSGLCAGENRGMARGAGAM